MISISTSWNSRSTPDAKAMLSQIKDVGFEAIEISHHFSLEKMQEVLPLLDNLKVSSLHNFSPLPGKARLDRSTSDYYRLSSLDEEERVAAVEATKNTIAWAKKFSAQAVVVHAGTVELDEPFGRQLIELYNQGKVDSAQYWDLKERFFRARSNKSGPHIEAVVKSLKDILPCAQANDIKIGLETRYYPEEIPNFEEAKYLLSVFGGDGLYYWHDVGHAEANERLGIAGHLAYLEEFSGNLLGMHLHDIVGTRDHLAPFTGEFDFAKIYPFMSEDIIKVIEVGSTVAKEDIDMAFKRLKNKDLEVLET